MGGAKKGGQGRPPLQEVRCKPGGERADEGIGPYRVQQKVVAHPANRKTAPA